MEKIKVFKVTVFPDITNPAFANAKPTEIFLPVDQISHFTLITEGNPISGYSVHFKKDHSLNLEYPVKSINSVRVDRDSVEVLSV